MYLRSDVPTISAQSMRLFLMPDKQINQCFETLPLGLIQTLSLPSELVIKGLKYSCAVTFLILFNAHLRAVISARGFVLL